MDCPQNWIEFVNALDNTARLNDRQSGA